MLSILLYIRNLVSWLNKWWRSVVYLRDVSALILLAECVPCALHIHIHIRRYSSTGMYSVAGLLARRQRWKVTWVLIPEFMAQSVDRCPRAVKENYCQTHTHTQTHPILKDFDVPHRLSVCLFQGKEPKSRKFPAQKLFGCKKVSTGGNMQFRR